MSPPGPNREFISEPDFSSEGNLYPKIETISRNKDTASHSSETSAPIVDAINLMSDETPNNRKLSSVENYTRLEDDGSSADNGRKGWKGLSSLEKSLYVALGVVSTLCVALMIAVIVVGIQNQEECDAIIATTTLPATTRKPIEPPPDYCNTTVPERPPRRGMGTRTPSPNPTTSESSTRSTFLKNSLKHISSAECIKFDDNSSSICLTPQCFEKASEIIASIDSSVDPCENFYQFACGKWDINNRIPDYMISWNPFEIQRQKRHYEIKGLLEKEQSLLDSRSLRLAKQFYHSCMHPSDDEVGLAEMRLLAEEMTTSLFDETYNMQSLTEMLAKQRRFFNTNFIVSLSVDFDNTNTTSRKSIYLDKHTAAVDMLAEKLNLDKANMPHEDEVVQRIFQNFVEKLWSIVFSEDEVKSGVILADVLDFERNLSKITATSKNNSEDFYFDLEEIELSTGMKSWLVDFVASTIDENELNVETNRDSAQPRILLKDIEYFSSLENLLNSTSLKTIVNYLRLSTLLTYGPHAARVIRNLFLQYKESILKMEVLPKPRWLTCTEETNEFFGWTTSFHLSSTANGKQQLNEVTSRIKDAVIDALDDLDWVPNNDTRQFAKRKIAMMDTFVAFPDGWLDGKFDLSESIDTIYADVNFTDPYNYFQNYIETLMWLTSKRLADVYKFPSEFEIWPTVWEYAVKNSGSFYFGKKNLLAVQLVFEKSGFKSDTIFPSIFYGSVGVQIAQKILQAVDESGKYRGPQGNPQLWWDSVTSENYENSTSCFKEQLEVLLNEKRYEIEDFDQTVREIISKSGSLSIAFTAYQSQIFNDLDEVLLPGLQDYTAEQLFYLSFAQSMCSTTISPFFEESDNFSDEEVVLESVLRNSEFAKHWHCPLPDGMNTCKIF